jgi:hypothetical protein
MSFFFLFSFFFFSFSGPPNSPQSHSQTKKKRTSEKKKTDLGRFLDEFLERHGAGALPHGLSDEEITAAILEKYPQR